ncbi:hypothetical protein B0T21DRAFT_279765, partial [Apiosordaria backusii]
ADGQRLASGSRDGTVKIWDPVWGRCLQTLESHSSLVSSVAFSSNRLGTHEYGLGACKTCVICNGRNVLWLPPEYHPTCSAVQGRMVARHPTERGRQLLGLGQREPPRSAESRPTSPYSRGSYPAYQPPRTAPPRSKPIPPARQPEPPHRTASNMSQLLRPSPVVVDINV